MAIKAMGAMGPEAEPCLAAVREALTDSDPDVRRLAAEALFNIEQDKE
jgi:HEAT repeat protein